MPTKIKRLMGPAHNIGYTQDHVPKKKLRKVVLVDCEDLEALEADASKWVDHEATQKQSKAEQERLRNRDNELYRISHSIGSIIADIRKAGLASIATTIEVLFSPHADDQRTCCERAIFGRLNTPEMVDFLEAVKLEAAHQQERWEKTDKFKDEAEWYWLIGWLGGKAITDPHEKADKRTAKERKQHRVITVAAAAYNWHRAIAEGSAFGRKD